MKNWQTCFAVVVMFFVFFSLFSSVSFGQTSEDITPTDVWYLAKSIDDSLISLYQLTGKFSKKRISNNLRPRNVYQKTLSVAEEFNHLHPNALDSLKLSDAYTIDMRQAKPADNYSILHLIKDWLISKNKFVESAGERTAKNPNDVFQMLRQISFHHTEIAGKLNIATTWGSPARVYEAVVTGVLPAVEGIADEAGVKHEDFLFPKQPVSGVKSRNVYHLLSQVYNNISRYYMNRGGYEPIIIEEVSDCDDISPADVFDLATIISTELKARTGNKAMSAKTAGSYSRWKEGKDKIVPGDVFRLIQYNYILSRNVLEK